MQIDFFQLSLCQNDLRDFPLQIYTKFLVRTSDTISVPEIRLKGKWLEKLGFVKGADISIQQETNKLIITLDEEKGHSPATIKLYPCRKSKSRKKITPEIHPAETLFMQLCKSDKIG